jgi:hypothetical protein
VEVAVAALKMLLLILQPAVKQVAVVALAD